MHYQTSFHSDKTPTTLRYESSDIGTAIGAVGVEQETPALDGLVYSIQESSLTQFLSINSTTGVITSTEQLDREIHPRFNVTVSAYLPSALTLQPAETTVVVTVQVINDHEPMFTQMLYSRTVLTTSVSTSRPLTQVMATDADSGSNSLLTYSIESISPPEYSQYFYITFNGSIYTNSTNISATTYRLRVSVQDMGNLSLSSSTNVTITILHPVPNRLDFTQQDGYTFRVYEGEVPDTVVGRVQVDGISDYIQ